MDKLEMFIICFLTFWSIVFICFALFGWFSFNKHRNKSIKEFKEKHRTKL